MSNSSMVALAKNASDLKKKVEQYEATLKAAKEMLDDIMKTMLPKAMEDAEVEKFTVEGVGTVYLTTDVFAYVKKEDEPQFHAWLVENGAGDMIKPYVFPQTLKAWAKEQLGEGTEVPEFCKITTAQKAVIRSK